MLKSLTNETWGYIYKNEGTFHLSSWLLDFFIHGFLEFIIFKFITKSYLHYEMRNVMDEVIRCTISPLPCKGLFLLCYCPNMMSLLTTLEPVVMFLIWINKQFPKFICDVLKESHAHQVFEVMILGYFQVDCTYLHIVIIPYPWDIYHLDMYLNSSCPFLSEASFKWGNMAFDHQTHVTKSVPCCW